MDPWGMTSQQTAVLQTICETGSTKGAARVLGLSSKTVEEHFRRAKAKFGVSQRLICLLEWDRWARRSHQASLSEQVAKLDLISPLPQPREVDAPDVAWCPRSRE